MIRTDVLRDAARFARDDVRLSDVVEQRRLSVVDVTHDRDDRRTRDEILGQIGLRRRARFVGLIRVFANGLEAEFAGDELDLIEVESLVDRDHQAQFLEGERDDLRRRRLEDLRKLADRDELVDANGLSLALGLGGASRLELLARAATQVARRTTRRCAAHGRHRLRDVRIHRFLIDRTALALFPTTAAIGDAGASSTAATTAATTASTAATATTAAGPDGRLSSRRAMPGPPPGAADAIGRGGNPPLLATGRGRGAPGVTGRGRGRSGAPGCAYAGRHRTRAIGRGAPT